MSSQRCDVLGVYPFKGIHAQLRRMLRIGRYGHYRNRQVLYREVQTKPPLPNVVKINIPQQGFSTTPPGGLPCGTRTRKRVHHQIPIIRRGFDGPPEQPHRLLRRVQLLFEGHSGGNPRR